MDNKILVAYATKYGATAEIAERIGEVLVDAGLAVDVLPVEQVDDLYPYSAVVLGSAVYAGSWRREAAAFLERYERELAVRPVWFFSSGPTGEGNPVALMKGWRLPDAQQSIADRIVPREITVFHGSIDASKLNLAERLIVKAVRAPSGDYRDWEAIAGWASDIAATLSLREPARTMVTPEIAGLF